MDRRRYLTVLLGGMAFSAGCLSDDEASNTTPNTDVPTTLTDIQPDENTPTTTPTKPDENTPTPEPDTPTSSTEPEVNGPVTIIESELTTASTYPWIRGIAQNGSDRALEYVELDGYVYDADGVRLGQSFDNAADLPPGQKWQFKMPFLDVQTYNVERYELTVSRTRFA